jgi:hypothetical protein
MGLCLISKTQEQLYFYLCILIFGLTKFVTARFVENVSEILTDL